jgi:hypothetical protein
MPEPCHTAVALRFMILKFNCYQSNLKYNMPLPSGWVNLRHNDYVVKFFIIGYRTIFFVALIVSVIQCGRHNMVKASRYKQ